MKTIIKAAICSSTMCLISGFSFAAVSFIAVDGTQENARVLMREGDCEARYAPCSSFKITLALMGYDTGILTDENNPEWPFQDGYADYLDQWKQPHTPTMWMRHSCVWFSQVLTPQLTMERFQKYVNDFDYGNRDLSGDKGKYNGLTNAWLSSSLEISVTEQLGFIGKLLRNELPVSPHAHQMTRNILYVEDLPHGWKLFGKTGSGSLLISDRITKTDVNHGWFIGWTTHETTGRTISFACHITDDVPGGSYGGPRAKEAAKARLFELTKE